MGAPECISSHFVLDLLELISSVYWKYKRGKHDTQSAVELIAVFSLTSILPSWLTSKTFDYYTKCGLHNISCSG